MDINTLNVLLAVILAVISIAASLITVTVKLIKFIKKWDSWVERKDRHDTENYLTNLRLTIMSPYMPLSERIKAGDVYIKLGGNGDVKRKYYELIEKSAERDVENVKGN